MGFVGGQYIIVNTGVSLPGGKVAKRAYSIFSSDAEQNRFQIAVKRIESGPGSSYMHSAEPGTNIPFSGPWGQYLPEDSRPRTSTWVLATDTGITAALGLVRGTKFTPQLPGSKVIWFVPARDYFIPESKAREMIPSGCKDFRLEVIPDTQAVERPAAVRALIREMAEKGLPESVFLSGDGNVLYPLRDDLISAGVPESGIRLECFFNNPFKKAPA